MSPEDLELTGERKPTIALASPALEVLGGLTPDSGDPTYPNNPDDPNALDTSMAPDSLTPEQLQELRELRVIKLHQQLKKLTNDINQTILETLRTSLLEDFNSFQQGGRKAEITDKQLNKDSAYTQEQLSQLIDGGKAFHHYQPSDLDPQTNSFTFGPPDNLVTVQLVSEQNPTTNSTINRISITGNKDNIIEMEGMVAKIAKQIGRSNTKYIIYPSDDLDGVAELTGRVRASGLEVVFKPKPPENNPDNQQAYQEFADKMNDPNINFENKVTKSQQARKALLEKFKRQDKGTATADGPQHPTVRAKIDKGAGVNDGSGGNGDAPTVPTLTPVNKNNKP